MQDMIFLIFRLINVIIELLVKLMYTNTIQKLFLKVM